MPKFGASADKERRVMKGVFALASVVLLSSAQYPAVVSAADRGAAPAAFQDGGATSYHIGVDDLVQVSVWHNPDLSATVPVRPDGKISLPLVGDVDAGGRAPTEVAADVKQRLAAYVRDPQVAVIVTELRSHEY